MIISKRLQTIVDMIDHGSSVADIGSDHGYVPIFVCKQGKVKRAVAADIHSGPLEKAKENIKLHSLEHAVTTRLCGGMTGFEPGEVNTAVIAGMGGMIIRKILLESPEAVNSLRQLVLQPQLDVDEVRRTVHEIGFCITDEIIIYEDGKYYPVINCHKGEDVLYTDIDYIVGRIPVEKKDKNLRNHLQLELLLLHNIRERISRGQTSGRIEKRLKEIDYLEGIYTEVLKCL